MRGIFTAMLAASLALFLAVGPASASDREEQKLTAASAKLDTASDRADQILAAITDTQRQLKRARINERFAEEKAQVVQIKLDRIAASADAERAAAMQDVRRVNADHEEDLDAWKGAIVLLSAVAASLLVIGLGFIAWIPLLTGAMVRRIVGWSGSQAAGIVAGSGLFGVIVGVVIAGSQGRVAQVLGGVVIGGSIGGFLVLGLASWEGRRLATDRPTLVRRSGRNTAGRKAAAVGICALLFLTCLGASLSSPEPEPKEIPSDTLALAGMGSAQESPTPRMLVMDEALDARLEAVDRMADRRENLEDLLDSHRSSLADAKFAIRKANREFTRWEAALAKPDPVPIVEYEAPEYPDEEPSSPGGGCDPNYSGCVPAYPPDVNCADIGGSVSVIGSDPHGLDADNDGIGCE